MEEPRRMTRDFEVAPDEVITLAKEIIEEHHPWLKSARIGFLMRREASKSMGRTVLGYARKVSPEQQVFAPFDFIITLANDRWEKLSDLQKRALVDHELSHCGMGPNGWAMKPHQIEEFFHIWQRYGFWYPTSGDWVRETVQQALLDHPGGTVEKVQLQPELQWVVAEQEEREGADE